MDVNELVFFAMFLLIPLIFGRRLIRWAKKMPKGAYLLIAFLPLITLFPIPPPAFKNVEKAKQEQRKPKKQNDDPLLKNIKKH
ncbi:hypothetical protein [Pseudoalteromonas xiamenensis]|uniref:hypothetical protein n=1 Tax=Pseudoalteromonas xiamenensis TaxID=882626 RepID=UPI00366CFCC5